MHNNREFRKKYMDKCYKSKNYNKIKKICSPFPKKRKKMLVRPGYDTLVTAFNENPDIIEFILKPGTYLFEKQFDINRDHVTFRGLKSKNMPKLYSTDPSQNLINIDSHYVTLDNLCLVADHTDEIALTFSDVDNILIQNCVIYGSNNYFAVYIAGRTFEVGDNTINGVLNNTLDVDNKFINNTVISSWEGDMFAFALQKNGLVENNTFIGGKAAIYLVRDTTVSNNKCINSSSSGIHLSNPSFNVNIINNEINGCIASGIFAKMNEEHFTTVNGKDILIENNVVDDSRFFGIELNDIEDCNVISNNINRPDFLGMYVQEANNINIKNNNFIDVLFYPFRVPLYNWTVDAAILLEYQSSFINVENNNIKFKKSVVPEDDYDVVISNSNNSNVGNITIINNNIL